MQYDDRHRDYTSVTAAFARIGARARLRPLTSRISRWRRERWSIRGTNAGLIADVARDRRGEFFDLVIDEPRVRRLCVLEVRPRERHLVLLSREVGMMVGDLPVLQDRRLLCGHDERSWFIAAVPHDRRVTTVRQAMEALKPDLVRASQARHGVRHGDLNRRRNAGFVRQGEWFFVPDPTFDLRGLPWLTDEPLVRGGGKPHIAERLVRFGGTQVLRHRLDGSVMAPHELNHLLRRGQTAQRDWEWMVREPLVYVRGAVRHPDHATVTLPIWHRVMPNTESGWSGASGLAFLD